MLPAQVLEGVQGGGVGDDFAVEEDLEILGLAVDDQGDVMPAGGQGPATDGHVGPNAGVGGDCRVHQSAAVLGAEVDVVGGPGSEVDETLPCAPPVPEKLVHTAMVVSLSDAISEPMGRST